MAEPLTPAQHAKLDKLPAGCKVVGMSPRGEPIIRRPNGGLSRINADGVMRPASVVDARAAGVRGV
jgi:hypothetical protein